MIRSFNMTIVSLSISSTSLFLGLVHLPKAVWTVSSLDARPRWSVRMLSCDDPRWTHFLSRMQTVTAFLYSL